jgi:outer membrane protein TolC
LTAADANIIAARAAMLPSISLSGDINAGSNRLSSVFDNPVYSLAAGLAAPIFNAGRLAAGRDLAVAQREELLANYRRAIVAAFGDVETAMNAVSGIDAQRVAQEEELRQAQRALTLAESRYRAGAETSLTLLDAQRTLYAAQDTAAQLRTLRLQASVSLYKALGGGWQSSSPSPT